MRIALWPLVGLCMTSVVLGGVARAQETESEEFTLFDPAAFLFSLTLENRGYDGEDWRATALAQNYNLWDRGHLAYVGYQTPPVDITSSYIVYGGYELPLRGGFDRIGLHGYVSEQDFTSAAEIGQDPFSGSFEGFSAELRYKRNLVWAPRADGVRQHDVGARLQVIQSETAVDQRGEEFQASVTTAPVRLAYEFVDDRRLGLSFSGFVAYLRNLSFGPFDDEVDYSLNRPGADPNYDVFRFSLATTYNFASGWFVSSETFAQFADEPLISPVSFAIGGRHSVRALEEGEAFGDSGVEGTFEVFTPAVFGESPWQTFFVGFVDAAIVWRRAGDGVGSQSDSAVGLGTGLRWRGVEFLEGDIDVAYLVAGSLKDDPLRDEDDDLRVLFALTATF